MPVLRGGFVKHLWWDATYDKCESAAIIRLGNGDPGDAMPATIDQVRILNTCAHRPILLWSAPCSSKVSATSDAAEGKGFISIASDQNHEGKENRRQLDLSAYVH